MRKIVGLITVVLIAVNTSIAALAAGPGDVTESLTTGKWCLDAKGWWWLNQDGKTWPSGTWKWLDGNQDRIAECYYFDANGYMLANTTTPDGNTVNENGAWTENGTVQTVATSQISTASLPTAKNTGNSTATQNVSLPLEVGEPIVKGTLKKSTVVSLFPNGQYYLNSYYLDGYVFDLSSDIVTDCSAHANSVTFYGLKVGDSKERALNILQNIGATIEEDSPSSKGLDKNIDGTESGAIRNFGDPTDPDYANVYGFLNIPERSKHALFIVGYHISSGTIDFIRLETGE